MRFKAVYFPAIEPLDVKKRLGGAHVLLSTNRPICGSFVPILRHLSQNWAGIIMAWKEMNKNELADSLGVNVAEVREKQKLIHLIAKGP